jgi:glucose/arabinose dehydrogenase
MKLFSILSAALFLTTTGFAISAFAAHHESGDHAVAAELGTEETVWASGGRALVAEVEGEVIAVDLETREVVVRGPAGNFVTLTAREDGVDLSKIAVGDTIIADYIASVEAEVRAPTEEESANPWVVMGEMGRTTDDADMTAAGAARLVRAVCTIEAMDRNGNVVIKDARGRMHTVGGVELEKLDNVRLGDTVVVVFTEALVLSLKEV